MNIINKTSTINTSSKKNREIKYIVIHYTAGVTSSGKSDENTAAWFAKSTTKASSDFIVDDDSITQFNGDIKNRYSWHCGGSKYNNTKGGSLYKVCTNANSIGIEICSNNKTGKVTTANDANWYFTEASINNAVELVKKLMKDYNISIDNVIRHWDVTGKPCPGIIGWNADSGDESQWISFKKRLTDATDDYKSKYTDLLLRYDAVVNEKIAYKEKYEDLLDKYSSLQNKINEIKKIAEE